MFSSVSNSVCPLVVAALIWTFIIMTSLKVKIYWGNLGPYYKSELELKSNSSEILPVNCSSSVILFQLKLTKLKLSGPKKDMNTDKLAINWQNIARVRLQLKFAFIIRVLSFTKIWDSMSQPDRSAHQLLCQWRGGLQ